MNRSDSRAARAGRTAAGLALAAISAALTAPARAAETPNAAAPDASDPAGNASAAGAGEAEALARFERGAKLLQAGNAAEALPELERSNALLASPNTELLLAHALRQLGRRVDAMRAYEAVVSGAGARLRAGEERFRQTLADAGRWVALLRAELGALVVVVASAPSGVLVTIDGAAIALEPAGPNVLRGRAWREPGNATVRVVAPGRALDPTTIALGAGAERELRVDLAPPRSSPEAGTPAVVWVAAGAGVVGLGVFAVFGARAASAASDLEACRPCADTPANRDLADTGQRDAIVANVALGVGVAGLVTAGAIFLATRGKSVARRSEPNAARAARVANGTRFVTVRF